jgi:hypothetical protein
VAAARRVLAFHREADTGLALQRRIEQALAATSARHARGRRTAEPAPIGMPLSSSISKPMRQRQAFVQARNARPAVLRSVSNGMIETSTCAAHRDHAHFARFDAPHGRAIGQAGDRMPQQIEARRRCCRRRRERLAVARMGHECAGRPNALLAGPGADVVQYAPKRGYRHAG